MVAHDSNCPSAAHRHTVGISLLSHHGRSRYSYWRSFLWKFKTKRFAAWCFYEL